jgi:ABC-type Fe3+/spermidine/putrescine transport system ATPase subunit
VIKLENISVVRQHTQILKNVSLELPTGSFTSILGPSGAGKTTLLQVLCGLTDMDSGSVSMDGEALDNMAACKRNISCVFQDARLFPHMSVGENVAFQLRVRGIGREEREACARAMLKRVHLAGFELRRPQEISGGQQQRVALARSLVCRPQAVLLDEPFSGLDEALRHDMRELVLELHEKLQVTMCMVTHDVEDALLMSDQIALIDHGQLTACTTPKALVQTGALVHGANDALALAGHVADGTFLAGKLALETDAAPGDAVLVLAGCGGHVVSLEEADGVADGAADGAATLSQTAPAGEKNLGE